MNERKEMDETLSDWIEEQAATISVMKDELSAAKAIIAEQNKVIQELTAELDKWRRLAGFAELKY